MEEQTAKSDARNGLQNDIPRLQSMLAKLNLIHKHPKTDNVKLHPGTACKSMFYHSLEPEEGIKNEEDRKESTVRSGDEEQPTRSSETKDGNEAVEEVKELPEAFPKWERKSLLPDCLSIEIQMGKLGRQPRETESLEDKKSTEMEEHVAGAALLPNNQYQEMSAHTSYLSVSSDKVDSAQMGLKHEPDEACGPSKQYVSMDTSRVLTHQTAVNVTGKTTRSTSDPVTQESSKSFNPIKEERPLSAPSISNLREYEKYEDFANAMPAKSFSKAAKILGQGYSGMSIGNVEHDNSLTKTQKKGVKNKMKNLTQKLMEKLKDKHDCEHAGRRSTQDSMEEEEGQKLNSMEVEAEDQAIPPPLPPKMGKYVFLERTFTLKDFKLNLEPINLMEEIFTGSEWLSYLPIKESPAEKETSDQSMTNDVLRPEKDIQLDVPPPTAEQDQSEDIKTPEEDQPEDVKTPEEDQPEDVKVNQDSASDPQEDNVAKVKSDLDVKQVEWDANIFAIPKALLTNNARQKRSCESNKSDDVYDCVDMYIIPKNDFPLMKRKASDALLDFSAVKSFELLDNSALKSRIRLSKKRHHRSPKKHKKVKTEMLSGIFYKIPMVILNESPVSASPPCHSIPFSMSPPLHLPSRPYHS